MMHQLNLIICVAFLAFSLVPEIHGNQIQMKRMQRTLDHIFTEMGKFRRDLSFMEVRIDVLQESIDNITEIAEVRNDPSPTDTGTSKQPARALVEDQGRDEKDRVEMKAFVKNAVKSLSNEKLHIRNMLKNFEKMIRDGAIGNEVDERIQTIEDKLKENPVQANNPENKVEPAIFDRGDVRYSFSARLGRSRDILPDPRGKRLGHKMHSKRVQFEDVIHNDGNMYDPLTGKFTCKKNGVYLFVFFVEGHFRKLHGASGQTSMLALSVDGKYQTLAASKAFSEYGRNTGGNSVILKLIKGQEVWLETVAPISQVITLREWVSTFSGTLLY